MRSFLVVVAAVVVWQASTGHAMQGLVWVAAFWAIPVIFSQIAVAHFNYVTHVGLPSGRGEDTRNLTQGIWPLINLLTFNLYLHREHHLHPSQPVPRLPAESESAEKKVSARLPKNAGRGRAGGEVTLPPPPPAAEQQPLPHRKAA